MDDVDSGRVSLASVMRSTNRLVSPQPPKFYAPLICRVVRAVRVLGAGLGFPVGEPSALHPQPPISLDVLPMLKVIRR